MPASKEKLPSTLERSPKKVRKTYEKTLDAAHEQYDSEERAHRTAWDSVKHLAEKKGDHWELKDRKGPLRRTGGEERAGGAARRSHLRRSRRDEAEVGALRGRQAGRNRGPLEHDQATAGRGAREALAASDA